MDKAAIKMLFRWLESATDDEIQEKLNVISEAEQKVRSKEGIADLKLARRLIDEEILSRLDLLRLGKRG